MSTITDRLPPKELENQRYKELYEAIDEYWEQSVTAILQRMRNSRSVFTADNKDINLILEELTTYFDSDSDELSRPVSIFWKKNEINNKNNQWAVEALLQRIKIVTKELSYVTLYAPKDVVTKPYGSAFYTKEELEDMEVNVDDYFMTSHMQLNLDFSSLEKYDWDKEQIKYVMERYFEENVRPTHIVFKGVNFFISSPSLDFKIYAQAQINKITVSKFIS